MIPVSPEPAVAEMVKRAASGDAQAQADLAKYSIEQISTGAVTFLHGVQVADVMARMAASRGGASERLLLAGILVVMAEGLEGHGMQDAALACQSESLAIVSDLADEGDETAATALQKHAGSFPIQAFRNADIIVRHYSTAEV